MDHIDFFVKKYAMLLSDNSFIQLSESTNDDCNCNALLPVSVGSDIRFSGIIDHPTAYKVYLTNLSGQVLAEVPNGLYSDSINAIVDCSLADLSSLAVGDCFRLKLAYTTYGDSYNYYTNPFLYIGCRDENTVLFEYAGLDPLRTSFNVNFAKSIIKRVRLNCIIDSVQSKTEKTEYTESTGYVRMLSKTHRKEYQLQTDFYPEFIHNAIEEMLLYPSLSVDGLPVYESGDYEIDWEDKDENGNAKATTDLSEQLINRFSINE
jgi:hypothetical protein